MRWTVAKNMTGIDRKTNENRPATRFIAADGLSGTFREIQIGEIIVSMKRIMNAVLDDFLFQICHDDDLLRFAF